jgi:hypothetical protein
MRDEKAFIGNRRVGQIHAVKASFALSMPLISTTQIPTET